MANIAEVVITGYAACDPKQWNTNSRMPACSFRVGSTRRYFSAKDNQWKSNETIWVNVKAFRGIAVNVMKGIKKGDPVIVVGNLTVDTWEKDGVKHTMPSIEATHVGFDYSAGRVIIKHERARETEYIIPAEDEQHVDADPGETLTSESAPTPFDYATDASIFTPPSTDMPVEEYEESLTREFAAPVQPGEMVSTF